MPIRLNGRAPRSAAVRYFGTRANGPLRQQGAVPRGRLTVLAVGLRNLRFARSEELSSDKISQVAQQRRLRLRADDLLDDRSAGEDAERRDVHDPVSLGSHRVLIHVQLDDIDLVGV